MLGAEHGSFLLFLMINARNKIFHDGSYKKNQTRTVLNRHPHFLASVPMVARSSLVCALFALVGVVAGQDDDPFDCHIKTGDLNYNLTPLAGEHSISRERSTPPSTMVDIVRFDLCADLKPQEGAAEKDQV